MPSTHDADDSRLRRVLGADCDLRVRIRETPITIKDLHLKEISRKESANLWLSFSPAVFSYELVPALDPFISARDYYFAVADYRAVTEVEVAKLVSFGEQLIHVMRYNTTHGRRDDLPPGVGQLHTDVRRYSDRQADLVRRIIEGLYRRAGESDEHLANRLFDVLPSLTLLSEAQPRSTRYESVLERGEFRRAMANYYPQLSTLTTLAPRIRTVIAERLRRNDPHACFVAGVAREQTHFAAVRDLFWQKAVDHREVHYATSASTLLCGWAMLALNPRQGRAEIRKALDQQLDLNLVELLAFAATPPEQCNSRFIAFARHVEVVKDESGDETFRWDPSIRERADLAKLEDRLSDGQLTAMIEARNLCAHGAEIGLTIDDYWVYSRAGYGI